VKTYKAVLFSPDGDWVVDYGNCETKEQVIDRLANRGSRWYFFPFEGIILDKGGLTTANQRLLDVAPNLPRELVGKSIKTVKRWFERQTDTDLYYYLTGG